MATTRDMEAIERRRLNGARLLKRGIAEAEIARRLRVSRQTTNTWARQLREVNGAVGKLKAKPLGHPKRLDAQELESLRGILLRGALEAGLPTELWTIARVRAVVKREFGVPNTIAASINSFARRSPTALARFCVPPPPGIIPNHVSERAKRACFSA